MNVQFLSAAEKELDDAVAWYNDRAAGLGQVFLDEFDRAVRRALRFPNSSPEIEPEIRRCLLTRFPYGVIYALDSENFIVIAVAHLHRAPRYWIDRL